MSWRVERKRAVVTGASAGIGRALALKLAAESVHLCLVDQDAENLRSTAAACRHYPILVEECAVDLTTRDAPAQIHQHALTTMGGIDILINNAGVGYYGPFEPMSDEQIEHVLSVNLTAALRLTNKLLPLLLQHERSHILNMGSIYALIPTRRSAAYHASKYGLLGFSEALRAEYAQYGLGVTCLCPGFVDTGLFERMLTPEETERRSPPAWLLTRPEKVAAAAVRAIQKNRRLATVTWSDWAVRNCSWLLPTVFDVSRLFQKRQRHSYGEAYLDDGPLPLTDIVKREGFPQADAENNKAEANGSPDRAERVEVEGEGSVEVATGDEAADDRSLPRG